jgi:hypothetical protein
VAGKVLDVLQRDALAEQIGDCCHPE